MNTSEMLASIARYPDVQVGEGADDDAIAHAEVALGVKFPGSYRAFLQRFGWARFAHEDLCGLGKGLPDHRAVVENTIFERSGDPRMPKTLATLLADGAGNHYCLDAGQKTGASGEECAVVFWDHERRCDDKVADDFASWLIRHLEDLSKPPSASWRD